MTKEINNEMLEMLITVVPYLKVGCAWKKAEEVEALVNKALMQTSTNKEAA